MLPRDVYGASGAGDLVSGKLDQQPVGPTVRAAMSVGGATALLAASWLVAANTRFALIAVAPLLPLIETDLGLSGTAAGVVFGLPILLMGVFAIPGGALAD